jgi:hypothetical protein
MASPGLTRLPDDVLACIAAFVPALVPLECAWRRWHDALRGWRCNVTRRTRYATRPGPRWDPAVVRRICVDVRVGVDVPALAAAAAGLPWLQRTTVRLCAGSAPVGRPTPVMPGLAGLVREAAARGALTQLRVDFGHRWPLAALDAWLARPRPDRRAARAARRR